MIVIRCIDCKYCEYIEEKGYWCNLIDMKLGDDDKRMMYGCNIDVIGKLEGVVKI